MEVERLGREHVADAARVLAAACAYDPAAAVADEKLFGDAPQGPALAFGVRHAGDLVGVAAVSARWLRLVAVTPSARGRGIGTALLAACEHEARRAGATRLGVLGQPGNYLAPGIDERNAATIAWLEKRGFARGTDVRENVLIALRDNPRVIPARAAETAARAHEHGYTIRRSRPDEQDALTSAISSEFGGAWPFEVSRALTFRGPLPASGAPTATGSRVHVADRDDASRDERSAATSPTIGGLHVNDRDDASRDERSAAHHAGRIDDTSIACGGVHVAERDGAYCAFAAHDGNNAGLGWFGPTGTWPAHRGQGLGEALLLACLVDVAAMHDECEVAWIGPRAFYERVAGIASTRRFVTMSKTLG